MPEGQGDARRLGLQAARQAALQHQFPAFRQPVVEDHVGREQSAVGADLLVLRRPQLDLEHPRLGDRCVGSVERTVGKRIVGPQAGQQDTRDATAPAHHGAGRKIQMAAGSDAWARTATYRRSLSAANHEVRAPETVGTRAMDS